LFANITVTSLADNVTTDGEITLREAIIQAEMTPGADFIIFDPNLVAGGNATILLSSALDDTGMDDGEYGPTAFIINDELTITGPTGPNGITISASNNFRHFHVQSAGSLTLDFLTLSNGKANGMSGGSGSGGGSAGMGGAILNEGTLTINNSTLLNNIAKGGNGGNGNRDAGGGGGGVGEKGVNGSNSAGRGGSPNSGSASGGDGGIGGGGGGGFQRTGAGSGTSGSGGNGGFTGGGGGGGYCLGTGGGSGTVTAGDGGDGGFGAGGGGGGATVSFNYSRNPGSGGNGGYGGGDGATGGSSQNSAIGGGGGGGAGMGGAIFNHGGTATITNSTFSNNTAEGGNSSNGEGGDGIGGAIFNRNGDVYCIQTTIANNSAIGGSSSGTDGIGRSGGIFILADNSPAYCSLNNTIVASNISDDPTGINYYHELFASGVTNQGLGNLIVGNTNFGGSIVSTADPLLNNLNYNGGPTLTHSLQGSSPAIDAGDNTVASSLTNDQRGNGFTRSLDGNINGTVQVDIGAYEAKFVDWGDAPDPLEGNESTKIILENGVDDQRITSVGNNENVSIEALGGSIAYNATTNEFLIVYSSDDSNNSSGLAINEHEIFVQRIDASNYANIGSPIRISDMGGIGSNQYRAEAPEVAWNSSSNQYLVVWEGWDNTGPLVQFEREIFGQLLNANGTEVGSDIRLSEMGDDSETDMETRQYFSGRYPDVAYSSTANQYLVVWQGVDSLNENTSNARTEIFGQIVNVSGAQVEADFPITAITEVDSLFDAQRPRITTNGSEFMVVYYGDYNLNGNEEIWSQRVTAVDGTLVGTATRLSDMGADPNVSTFRATNPDVTYNLIDDEFFVIWEGTDDENGMVPSEVEIFGQRISTAGVEIGSDLLLTEHGGIGDNRQKPSDPRISWNSINNQYGIAWDGDIIGPKPIDYVDSEDEVFLLTIDNLGNTITPAARISNAGPIGINNFYARFPDITFNSNDGSFFTIWEATVFGVFVEDEYGGGNWNLEREIVGQRTSVSELIKNYNTSASENGPSHEGRSGLFLGTGIDSENDAQISLDADGDDMDGTDDEDGIISPTTAFIYEEQSVTVDIIVNNTTAQTATLYGWIDFNCNGIFENSGERVSVSISSGTTGPMTLTFPNAPADLDKTFARFRLSTDAAAAQPTGPASDGEVEDYKVEYAKYAVVGNAKLESNCSTLTAASGGQKGALWHRTPINLSRNFRLSATIDLGTVNGAAGNPADGIAFVLHREALSTIGDIGGSLGYANEITTSTNFFPNSVAVAFRSYTGAAIEIWDNGTMGDVSGSPFSLNGISGPQPITINWNACDQMMTIDIGNDTIDLAWSSDMVSNYFGGDPDYIYWGFTAGTGGAFQEHSVCDIQMITEATDACSCAPFLQCGDQVSLNTSSFGVKTLPDCLGLASGDSPFDNNFSNSVWFQIEGTGETFTISTCGGEFYGQEIHVYEGTCGNYTCYSSASTSGCSNGAPSYTLNSTLGTTYTVMIGVFSNNAVEGKLQVDILCGDCTTRGNLVFTPPQNFYNTDMNQFKTDSMITTDNILFSGSEILYNAGEGIYMNEGFEVKSKAIYEGYTDGCPDVMTFAPDPIQKKVRDTSRKPIERSRK